MVSLSKARKLSPANQFVLALNYSSIGLMSLAEQLLIDLISIPQLSIAVRKLLANIDYVKKSSFLKVSRPFTVKGYSTSEILDDLEVEDLFERRTFLVDALLYKKENAKKTIAIFTGSSLNNLPRITMLHHMLSKYDCNVVYLRDHQYMSHLAGLAGCISTTPDHAAQELLALNKSLGADQMYCIGISLGGYAALLYGMHMKAVKIIGFSAFTNYQFENAVVEKYPELIKIKKNYPERMLDLFPIYNSNAFHPKVDLYYGNNNEIDSKHALRFQSLDNVKLCGIDEWEDHDTLKYVLKNAKFHELITDLLAQTHEVRT